ncbi:low molecular weight phosphotyrosine protein phosphatase [Paraconexibacter antarcticus]|uniref:protein-tyrosine-phosphatase n=1 Tax=Paraconexibacter antarcticus TaxID=2949664 RepID=A0ABY5DST0_9ACTN|nr:low molecular weight protein-tyrosine-phosphatase [Paraconexibacter antarcticus]UTI64021.1 low molecular weight phosphotyrosine protein phosphatase [Paraconexibacter antarcticus]
MTRLLFVCMGNICRSPTAEAVMRQRLEGVGLAGEVEVDSAGTGAWHVGRPPDERSAAAAARRGVTLSGAARQVRDADFADFDLLLCADGANVRELLARLAPDDPARARVRRLREFDPAAVARGDLDVPDPYYGGPRGFDDVLDLVTAACDGLLAAVRDGSLEPA